MINTRLICHLPLIIPEDRGVLRVGSEQRACIEGEMSIFDDSIQHEAWNDSDRERFVLLFHIWRPELARRSVGSYLLFWPLSQGLAMVRHCAAR